MEFDTHHDTHPWIAYICNADLRRIPGFAQVASDVTIEEAVQLHRLYTENAGTTHDMKKSRPARRPFKKH